MRAVGRPRVERDVREEGAAAEERAVGRRRLPLVGLGRFGETVPLDRGGDHNAVFTKLCLGSYSDGS